jgi:cytochrome c biogenesis protein
MTSADGDAMTGLPVDGQFRSAGTDLADSEAVTDAASREPVAGQQPGQVRLSPGGWLRWAWRQLTSMRTALILLFLLALASVPGSVLPQQGIDPAAVTQYYAAHPSLAPFLNRLSLFSVFAAPWFAAIYLLLFASLAGCVLPRAFRLAVSARQRPPRAPRNLARLPASASYSTALPPAQALQSTASLLGRRRFRLTEGDGWVSAEKGYLREVGNLLFHIALLALLFSVGIGGIFGYKANRLLVVGQGFANTPTALDVFRPGRLVSPSDLQPFSINLLSFSAKYVTSGAQANQPLAYNAALSYQPQPGGPFRRYLLQVNHPLVVDGVSVYLIGHGYAPVFKIADGTGRVRWDGPVPFIPVEQSGLTSEGVIKVPDAKPDQLGFAGVFLPTAYAANGRLVSVFPAALNPRVSLVAYRGNLGMNSGQPQSVYTLDTKGLRRLPIAPQPLAPGQSMKLPGGAGTLTFTGYKQWISLAITYDPGQLPALVSGIVALAGLILSFLVRRRRVFVRAEAGPDGGAHVTIGGLARSDAAGGFETEFAELAGLLRDEQRGTAVALPPGSGDASGQTDVDQPPEVAGGARGAEPSAGEDEGRTAGPAELTVTADDIPTGDDTPASEDRDPAARGRRIGE